MSKKTSKEILFERFEKIDPSFKNNINEEIGDETQTTYEIVPCNYGIVDESKPIGERLVAIGGEGHVIYRRNGIDFDEAMRVANEAKKEGY